jgi:hypothetical protein
MMSLDTTSTYPIVSSSATNPSISITTSTTTSDESALWVRVTLKQLTTLAITLHLVSPGALDTKSGLLKDEKLLRDLDWMSSGLAGELLYYLPKVEGVEDVKCRVGWLCKKTSKDGVLFPFFLCQE